MKHNFCQKFTLDLAFSFTPFSHDKKTFSRFQTVFTVYPLSVPKLNLMCYFKHLCVHSLLTQIHSRDSWSWPVLAIFSLYEISQLQFCFDLLPWSIVFLLLRWSTRSQLRSQYHSCFNIFRSVDSKGGLCVAILSVL